MQLSHVNQQGEANMVDVSGKAVTTREAIAEGELHLSAEALAQVKNNSAEQQPQPKKATLSQQQQPAAAQRGSYAEYSTHGKGSL